MGQVMHTSALKPLPDNWPQAQYTGTLIHPAEARTGLLDQQGKSVPVLCLDIELDNITHNLLHVEQPFPDGNFSQCQAAARRLKEGARVTVTAPLVGMRLVARNATHIHVIQEHAQQCQA
jgi:hypothetical protein